MRSATLPDVILAAASRLSRCGLSRPVPDPDRRGWRPAFALPLTLLGGIGSAAADYTTMVNNGPSSNRIDIVFLGDGYLAGDLNTTYVSHINTMLNHMFNQGEDPFVRYANFFNVHRVNVASSQTGTDIPPGTFRNPALDASYYYDGVTERLLYITLTTARPTTRYSRGSAMLWV